MTGDNNLKVGYVKMRGKSLCNREYHIDTHTYIHIYIYK